MNNRKLINETFSNAALSYYIHKGKKTLQSGPGRAILYMPQTADYSLFIQHPSPDLQKDSEWMKGKEVFTSVQSLRHLDHLQPIGQVNGVDILPTRVIQFLQSSIEAGNYRVELLDGETEYKLYRKFHEQAN